MQDPKRSIADYIFRPITKDMQDKGQILIKVNELKDHDTKWWTIEFLRKIFTQDDVRIICKLPLSYHNIERDAMI
jgi:hypothetical protein